MIPSWVIALIWQLFFSKHKNRWGLLEFLQSTFGIPIPDWLSYGYVPIVITLALHYYAYTFLMISGALRTIDSELEEAGAVAGLSRFKVLTKITFSVSSSLLLDPLSYSLSLEVWVHLELLPY